MATANAMVDNKKKYKPLEQVLTRINKDFISLSEEEIKRNNAILKPLLTKLTTKMKEKDNLFKEMYRRRRVFYGGSFYDGLRVGQPNEFDLDLVLSLPKLLEPILTTSNVPGYVNLQFNENNIKTLMKHRTMEKRCKGLEKLLDDRHYLDNKKVRRWMERVVNVSLNDFEKQNGKSIFKLEEKTFFIDKVSKSGPAFTLQVKGTACDKEICLDIDLVPCFKFNKEQWPANGFKPNPVSSKPNFFIVPKPLKSNDSGDKDRHWRLSFQEQERKLMDKKQYLKPTIKLLKKMRDVLDHKQIASYYIKTVALQETDNIPKDSGFWSSSLSNVFMTILKEYYECLKSGKIQYYWNKKNNLIQDISDTTKSNMSNKIKAIIDDIDRHLDPARNDPTIISKYLLTPTELIQFQATRMQV